MTKHFCDICRKEISYENRIDVSGWNSIQDSTYCINCFQNKRNWKSIHAHAAKQPSVRIPIAIKLKSAKIALV
jgi:hypothetical protein